MEVSGNPDPGSVDVGSSHRAEVRKLLAPSPHILPRSARHRPLEGWEADGGAEYSSALASWGAKSPRPLDSVESNGTPACLVAWGREVQEAEKFPSRLMRCLGSVFAERL